MNVIASPFSSKWQRLLPAKKVFAIGHRYFMHVELFVCEKQEANLWAKWFLWMH